ESRGVELWDLTDGEYADISEHLTPEVRTVLSTEGSLNSRNSQGGTAPAAVERQLVALEAEWREARHDAGENSLSPNAPFPATLLHRGRECCRFSCIK
ncbi:MAG: hypothetical protein ACK4K6_16060, partial [Pseudarthrobacter sp.]